MALRVVPCSAWWCVVLGVVPPRSVVQRLGVVLITTQFVVFKPLSYCFKETIGFDKEASFKRPPVSPLIKPVDITKEL